MGGVLDGIVISPVARYLESLPGRDRYLFHSPILRARTSHLCGCVCSLHASEDSSTAAAQASSSSFCSALRSSCCPLRNVVLIPRLVCVHHPSSLSQRRVMAKFQSFPFKLLGTTTMYGGILLVLTNFERITSSVLSPFQGMVRSVHWQKADFIGVSPLLSTLASCYIFFMRTIVLALSSFHGLCRPTNSNWPGLLRQRMAVVIRYPDSNRAQCVNELSYLLPEWVGRGRLAPRELPRAAP